MNWIKRFIGNIFLLLAVLSFLALAVYGLREGHLWALIVSALIMLTAMTSWIK